MKLYEKKGVRFYRSELLPCPHGFATRIGGVSTLPHTASLNLAFGRGDDEGTVLRNLECFTEAIGVSSDSVVSFPQVHGNTVLRITESDRGKGYRIKVSDGADGYITTDQNVSIGIKTADCVPILLCGLSGSGKVIAVSAVHAGWRGTALRIAEKGVQALLSVGVERNRICAAIGPAIGKCCYEVGENVYSAFCTSIGKELADQTFSRISEASPKYMADLKEINRRILLHAGIEADAIDVSDACTCCYPDLFFSHRYSNGIRGTMLSLIALPQER